MARGISQTVSAINPKNFIISSLHSVLYELGNIFQFVDKIASQKKLHVKTSIFKKNHFAQQMTHFKPSEKEASVSSQQNK